MSCARRVWIARWSPALVCAFATVAMVRGATAAPTGEAMTDVELGVEGEAEVVTPAGVTPRAVVSVVSDLSGSGADVALSQLELGLAFERSWFGAEGVLAVGDRAPELGLLVGSIRLAGPRDALLPASFELSLFGGQLDAPVGIDGDEYGDLERPMISAPLLLEATHGGWNDWGAGVRVAVGELEVSVFGARGYAAAADVSAEAWTPGPAFGARAVYQVLERLTVGASGVAVFDQDLTARTGLLELDAQLEVAGFAVKAEGLAQLSGDAGPIYGAYLTAHRAWWIFEAAARAELVVGAGEAEPRLGVTAGVQVWPEHVLVRAEYDTDLSRLEDRVQLQVVAAL